MKDPEKNSTFVVGQDKLTEVSPQQLTPGLPQLSPS